MKFHPFDLMAKEFGKEKHYKTWGWLGVGFDPSSSCNPFNLR